MKRNHLLSLSVLSLLFLASCNKEVDEPKTKTQLLTQHTWVIQKFEEKVGTMPWDDQFPDADACDKDDQYIFRTNNRYEINEGPLKCDPTDPQIIDNGTWSFQNNETVLDMDNDEFTIDLLNESSLILSITETFGGSTYQVKITFKPL